MTAMLPPAYGSFLYIVLKNRKCLLALTFEYQKHRK
jgi:hypothetical protein